MRIRLAAAGLLAGLSLRVLAQDAVLIEATRFPEDLRRLPASTTVITAEEIAASAARTLPELLEGAAGITLKDFYGNNAAVTSVDLRGFGVTGPQNTLILLDGRRLNDFDLSGVQWPAIPIASIERIEILRGTGAVLYGDAASAGVVNIVTRSPLKAGREARVFGRIASYNTVEGELYGSAANEQFGANASLYGYTSDGYRQNNRNEQQNASVNLRWALGEGALDLRAATDRQDLRLPAGRLIQPSIGLDQYAADPRAARTPLDYASRDGARIGATLLQRFGDLEASVGFAHREKDQRSYFDFGGFPSYRADDLALDSVTPRLRVPFATGGIAHRLTLGADFHEWRYRSRRSNRPENLAQPINRVAVTQETEGFYLHDSIELAEGTLATLGWRAERAKYAASDTVDAGAPGCFFCTGAPAVQETQRQRAWELGLRQALGERWSAFGRLGRSFRFVNAEEIYENDAFFAAQFQLLRPQHAETAEAGLEWRGNGHAARATLFRTEVTDEIHLDPLTAGVGNTNLPPSRRQGIELDGSWQATPALRVSGAYAYTDARFLSGTLAGASIAGRTVPLVPRHKLNAGLAWQIENEWLASAALTYASEQHVDNDEANTFFARIPAYAVVDFKLTRSFSWGRLALAVNNVFDERYYTYAVRSAFVADRYEVYPLPGRTLGLALELKL